MELTEEKIRSFVDAINEKLYPVAFIAFQHDSFTGYFKAFLRPNKYVDSDVIELTREYRDMVDDMGKKYFDMYPSWNNTWHTFWFDGEYHNGK